MTIPSNLRAPAVAAEINNSQANQGPALMPYRALLLGQKISSGTGTANTAYRVTSADQVGTLAGRGSMLHGEAEAWFAENTFTETWIMVLADNGAGAAAVGGIQFTGTATAAGSIQIYIGGRVVSVPVAVGDANTAIATALAALLPSGTDFPVTGAVDGSIASKVDITSRHKGLAGNEIDLRVNYQDGEALPAGITVSITAMTGGTLNPVLDTAIANLGDTSYNVIVNPYTDSTSLTALETELASRFGSLRQIPGVMGAAKNDTYSNVATLGNTRNSPHSFILRTNNSPTPPYEYAAAVFGVAAIELNADPARPLQTVQVPYIKAPAATDRDTYQERNLLLFDGISTTNVNAGGVVQIERLITTYKTNGAGAPDQSYLDVTTMFTLMYLRFSLVARFASKYPRHKLAADGTRIGPGQPVITPKMAKGECFHWFEDMEDLGLVQDFADFKSNLTAAIDPQNPNRLNIVLPPNLIDGLIITALTVQFIR